MFKKMLARLKDSQYSSESGFSLADLMVGAGLTTLVVAAGGTAIASMLDLGTTANARSERRVELNRALAFIETEVNRSSGLVETPAVPSELTDAVSDSASGIDIASITPVLQLDLPGIGDTSAPLSGNTINAISAQPVTYFTADSVDGSWRGPKVLYRWGPAFSASGDYVNPAAVDEWEIVALADRLEDFEATVAGNSVDLVPTGQIKRLLGRTESYAVEKSAGRKGAFVADEDFSVFSGAAGTRLDQSLFTITNGNVQIDTESTVTIQHLGGEVTCGRNGPRVPTLARAILTDDTGQSVEDTDYFADNRSFTYEEIAPGTTLKVEGWLSGDTSSGNCRNSSVIFNSQDDRGTQVRTLVDGDSIPEIRPFGNQRNLDAFLESFIDPDTRLVTLAPNEVIFFYELGSTNSNSAAYDLQDLVVLATIEPTVTVTQTSTQTTTQETETTASVSTRERCDNGLGNGSDGCTPGRARANDEVVRDLLGNVVCTPEPGNPCTQAAREFE